MDTRRWLALIWVAFVCRLAFYAAAFPIWEGFDEWAHFGVARRVAAGQLIVPRDAKLPLDVAASLQFVPAPRAAQNLPPDALSHEAFWALPASERGLRELHFQTIPREWRAESSQFGAYEALQPPLYYWLAAPVLLATRNAGLATQALALRWEAILLASFLIPLCFLVGKELFADSRPALGCAAVVALMPELAISMARGSNECLAVPLYTAVTWIAVRRRNWLAAGIVLGLGLLTKAYFLAAAVGLAAAFWAPRSLAIAAAISGWWYVRNLLTTGTVSGLSESVSLRGVGPLNLLVAADVVPWKTAVDSVLFSHLYFGGWSSLMVRSWMYHLLYLFIAVAAVGLIGLWRDRKIWSLAVMYGVFWLAQLYNVVLIFVAKGVPTSMGWYLYAVIGAQTALAIAGLRRILRGWAVALGAVLFGLLDLYAMNAVALPYYTGLLGRKANGALAAVRLSDVHIHEIFQRLTAFKPAYLTERWLLALWIVYLASTLALMAAGIRLARAAGKPLPVREG